MPPEPFLLPKPKMVRMHDGFARADAPLASVHDASIREGGYRLYIGVDRLEIRSAGEAGELAARTTLGQIETQFEARPCLEIEDWPDLTKRGFMLDVSRCRVPTLETLRGYSRLLADLKLNHFQLYTEHAFAYRDHERVWRDASPITSDEVRSLGEWCGERGIELAANQNCFGHLTPWLVHEPYAGLAETHGEYEFYGIHRRGPFSLCPTDPRSLELVKGLLDELMPCFESPLVNIGCDETADVGQGRSRAVVERRGKAAVYGEYVSAVAAHVIASGRTPMFWADIALSSPEVFERLPPELVSLAWGYEPDSPFESWCGALREMGRAFWVCPGLSGWRSFAGRTRERLGNLRAASEAVRAFGADAWLATEWGDLGHRQVSAVTLRGLADAASFAWSGEPADPDAVDLHVFGRAGVGAWLDALGDADAELRGVCGYPKDGESESRLLNASALFDELHPPRVRAARPGTLRQWEAALDHVRELAHSVPGSGDDPLSRELRHAAACDAFAAGVGVKRRSGSVARLAGQLEEIIREHAALWALGSRPGGLQESAAYWESLRGEVS